MTIALELREIRKRFTAGAGACQAFVDVLRGVDLVVHSGECAAVVGPPSSGKSTLLLCAAGLLTPERGDRAWFGATSRQCAARHALYHRVPSDLARRGASGEPHVHLVDDVADHAISTEVWIEERCAAGDAVVVACRDIAAARHLSTRILILRDGQLYPAAAPHARVAEPAHR